MASRGNASKEPRVNHTHMHSRTAVLCCALLELQLPDGCWLSAGPCCVLGAWSGHV